VRPSFLPRRIFLPPPAGAAAGGATAGTGASGAAGGCVLGAGGATRGSAFITGGGSSAGAPADARAGAGRATDDTAEGVCTAVAAAAAAPGVMLADRGGKGGSAPPDPNAPDVRSAAPGCIDGAPVEVVVAVATEAVAAAAVPAAWDCTCAKGEAAPWVCWEVAGPTAAVPLDL